jgi:putative salt-induced outer membrane protein
MPKKALILILFLVLGLFFISAPNAKAQEIEGNAPWKTHIEVSYVSTSGNTETETLSGKLEVKKEGPKNRYIARSNVLYARNNNEDTSNKGALEARWERTINKRLFGFLTSKYSRDKFSGYKYRISAGPGIGYDIIRTDKHFLKGLVSVLYNHDRYSEGFDKSDDYSAGTTGINYEWKILENLKFKENADYLVSFDDTDKYFINSETALEVKINNYLSLGLSYVIAYQNYLPKAGAEHVDTTFMTSLIIDF